MSFVEEISCHRFDWRWNTLRCNRASRGGTLLAVYNMALDYPQASASLRSRSVHSMQQQTALAIRYCHLNHREAPVKAEAEGAQVSLGVLVEVEGMKSAAEAGLEVTQQSVDPAELLGHWGASCW